MKNRKDSNNPQKLVEYGKEIKNKIDVPDIISLKKFEDAINKTMQARDGGNKIIPFIRDYIVMEMGRPGFKDEIRWIAVAYYSKYEKRFLLNAFEMLVEGEVEKAEIQKLQHDLFIPYYLYSPFKDVTTLAKLTQEKLKIDEPRVLSILYDEDIGNDEEVKCFLNILAGKKEVTNQDEIKIKFSDFNSELSNLRKRLVPLKDKKYIEKEFKEWKNSHSKGYINNILKHYYKEEIFSNNPTLKDELEKIYNGILLFFLADPKWKQINYFVVRFGEEVSNFGINIAFGEKLDKDEIERIKYIVFSLIKNLFFSIPLIEQKLRFHKSSALTAVAAIMSRNISHNIGSHIMSYIRNDLVDLEKFIKLNRQTDKGEQFKNWIEAIAQCFNENKPIKFDNNEFTKLRIPKMPSYLVGLSNFINYLQERQDFIATISNPEIKLFMPMNFKCLVFDNLLPDLIPPNGIYTIPVNLILSNIAKSEGYGRDKIKIYFRDSDGSDSQSESYRILSDIKFNSPQGLLGRQAFYSIIENFIRNTAKHSAKREYLEIKLDTPHLIYNRENKKVEFWFKDKLHFIDENRKITISGIDYKFKESFCKYYFDDGTEKKPVPVIAWEKKKYVLGDEKYKIIEKEIKIAEITDDKDFKLIFHDVYLESEKGKNRVGLVIDRKNDCLEASIDGKSYMILDYNPDEYIKFTLTDNNSNYFDAFSQLERGLNDDLIDESGQLKPFYKGIKDMKISAAWLRGLDLHEVYMKDNFPPIINYRCSQTKRKCPRIEKHCQIHPAEKKEYESNHIEYVFYLLKPKEILFILSDQTRNAISIAPETLAKEGIEIVSYDDFQKKSNLRHALNVIEKNVWNSNRNEIEQKINLRKVVLDKLELKTLLDTKRSAAILEDSWKKRLKKISSTASDEKIYIVDTHKENSDENDFIWKNTGDEYQLIDDQDARILFRKHNDIDGEFLEFSEKYKNFYNRLQFIEGISGANMTDLLIRKLPKTNLLRYKLIESCLTKILIIDERLWEKYRDTKSNAPGKKMSSKKEFEAFFTKIKDHEENDWLNERDRFLKKHDITSDNESLDKMRRLRDYPQKIISTFFGNLTTEDQENLGKENINYERLERKGIEIANIEHRKENKLVIFRNLKGETVGEFDKENGFWIIIPKTFHIATIHQGIIDKIQKRLGMEWKDFSKKFFNRNCKIEWIIHSGRGLPPDFQKNPPNAAFLSFSSLENALYNCKFVLTELVYNVKRLNEVNNE